jgi:hypothetical protein
MSDIFISYAREDRERAKALADVFEAHHWSVFWDRDIPPGRKFSDVIAEELASAKAIVVLWSAAAVASDWVKDEAQEGANRGLLIPALIDTSAIPFGFRQIQTADLSDWGGDGSHPELQSLVGSVARVIVQPPPLAGPVASLRGRGGKRRWLAGAAAVGVILAAFTAYKIIPALRGTGGDPVVNGRVTDPPRDPDSPSRGSRREARVAAAQLTAAGLDLVDPNGNHLGAILLFNEALAADDEYGEAYYYRGQSRVALGQTDKALQDFKKVVTLRVDAEVRQTAEQFIRQIEAPAAAAAPAGPTSGGAVTGGGPAGGGTGNPLPPPPAPTTTPAPETVSGGRPDAAAPTPSVRPSSQVPVGELFSAQKSRRIAATTGLILTNRQNPAAVSAAIRQAQKRPDDKEGVIQTLIYLQSVDPAILRQNRSGVEALLESVKDNGAPTAEQARKVRSRMGQ